MEGETSSISACVMGGVGLGHPLQLCRLWFSHKLGSYLLQLCSGHKLQLCSLWPKLFARTCSSSLNLPVSTACRSFMHKARKCCI